MPLADVYTVPPSFVKLSGVSTGAVYTTALESPLYAI